MQRPLAVSAALGRPMFCGPQPSRRLRGLFVPEATGHGVSGCLSIPRQRRSIRCATAALGPQRPHAPLLAARRLRAPRSPALLPPAATAEASSSAAVPWEEDWESMGPAFKATLGLLEWPALCEHVASFASTAVGKRMCRQLEVPLDQGASERLLSETRAIIALEFDYFSILDFGGINTGDAEDAIKRADKGGMVSGQQLRGLVTMLNGADKLKKQIQLAARQAQATGRDSPLRPLLDAVAGISLPGALVRDIGAAIGEDGDVQEASSERVRTTRARVRALLSRASNILKAFPGEVSERGGRVCVAVAAGTKITGGVTLGTTPGGGMAFVEPPQVMGINLELIAARAEAMAAEEAVLWDLSGRLMGVLPEVQACFEAVMWLDVLSAKARCGMWLGGILPEFTPWSSVFHARDGAARRRRAASGGSPDATAAEEGEEEERNGTPAGAMGDQGIAAAGEGWRNQKGRSAVEIEEEEEDGGAPVVRLKGLSHPLLLANYLRERERLQRALQALGASDSGRGAGGQQQPARAAAATSSKTRRALPNRRQDSSGTGSDEEDIVAQKIAGLRAELRDLRAPRPLDLFVQAETTVVVITGPNTGGKTATMKALGLAVAMAKAGIPIPAAAPARLPCFSAVLADIGDEQSLTANLSTFSGHLKRIQALRAEADGRALILLDELGTGTDPVEGAALGVALLRRLAKGGVGGGALTVATTHHSSMTKLKFEDPRFENASVEFDDQKLEPTYKLLWGVPGRSNALNIAARLGLDPSVIAAARDYLGSSASAANAAIADLEAVQGQLEGEEMALWAVEQEEEKLERKITEMRRSIAASRDALEQLRLERLSEVARAARAVARAIRTERRAAQRRSNAFDSELSRRIDSATLDALASGPTSVLSAIDDWRRASSGGGAGSSSAAAAAAGEGPGGEYWWVPAWRRLLEEARAALAAAKAVGVELDAPGGSRSPAGTASGSEEDDLTADLDILDRMAARRAEARAARMARDARRQELMQQALEMDAAKRRFADGSGSGSNGSGEGLLAAAGGAGQLDVIGEEEEEEEEEDGFGVDDLGLGLDLAALEGSDGRGGGGGARTRREMEQAAALSRLEAALSRVDIAAEARALQEAQEAQRREEEEQMKAAEREALARAEREQREQILMASSFEAQLQELEAAAAAAEAVASDGMGDLARASEAAAGSGLGASSSSAAGGFADDFFAEIAGLEGASGLGADGNGTGGNGSSSNGGLAPDLLALIGSLEGAVSAGPAADNSSNSSSSRSGGSSSSGGGPPQLPALQAASAEMELRREMERLEKLQAALAAQEAKQRQQQKQQRKQKRQKKQQQQQQQQQQQRRAGGTDPDLLEELRAWGAAMSAESAGSGEPGGGGSSNGSNAGPTKKR